MAGEGRGGSPRGFLERAITSESIRGLGRQDRQDRSLLVDLHSPSLEPITPEGADAQLLLVRDLKRSGLEPSDVYARPLDPSAKAICRLPVKSEGYVIPYFDISGTPIPHYRTRILNADYATNGVKYKQPPRSPNHIYFPRNFRNNLQVWLKNNPHRRVLIITEGEKKAVCATKFGFPAIALGGVDSWKSRTIVLPESTEFYSTKTNDSSDDTRRGPIRAKLPSSESAVSELIGLAQGFGDMLDLMTQLRLQPIIVFDSDRSGTVKAEVQRAATMLAYELVFLGIHAKSIKQLTLPSLEEGSDKTGLDDFIMSKGSDALVPLLDKILKDPQAFPRHPNPKGFISTQLQNKMSRKSQQQVASMILTELDAAGSRYRDKSSGFPYYYDRDTHHLIPATMIDKKETPLHETPFGTLLYKRYGISSNDKQVLGWLAAQFTGEEPIEETTPRRIITRITEQEDALNPYGLALQISDSHYIAISPEGAKLHTNGDKGILFVQDQVEPLDADLTLEFVDEYLEEAAHNGFLPPWWKEVIDESNIGLAIDQPEEGEETADDEATTATQDDDEQEIKYILTESGREMRTYATYLFYISPFLLRWRGLQLPVELTVGGPGSGKSSLYALRLSILTGRPKLRNIPTDIRDWFSSLANSGGLHVVDNVNFADKQLRQKISDELCRLTTSPDQEIEMRRYFTNVEELRIPISSTFAFTAIQMPFFNEDLIQRAVTLHTASVGREPKGDWTDRKLQERNGREGWMAHHIAFLVLFMREEWDADFHTRHRLAHLEQAMQIASRVLGGAPAESLGSEESLKALREEQSKNLGKVLMHNQSVQIVANDWVMRGIKEYIKAVLINQDPDYYMTGQGNRPARFVASDVSDWCSNQEDFCDNEYLINSRKLGRHMQERLTFMSQAFDIVPGPLLRNRQTYHLRTPPKDQNPEHYRINLSPSPPLIEHQQKQEETDHASVADTNVTGNESSEPSS